MATTVTIGSDGSLFVSEDKTFRLEVLDSDSVPVNIAGWQIVFDVRTDDYAPDPAIFTQVATISGTYNADRTINTQRAIVTMTEAELGQFTGSNLPNMVYAQYRHSWKRTTSSFATVLCRGDFLPEKATAP